jgi:hypothetical protein
MRVLRRAAVKKPEEAMEILEAYDATGSLRGAAALAGCEGSYVKPSLRDGGARPPIAVKGCRRAAR